MLYGEQPALMAKFAAPHVRDTREDLQAKRCHHHQQHILILRTDIAGGAQVRLAAKSKCTQPAVTACE
jgi:hypothetical protein